MGGCGGWSAVPFFCLKPDLFPQLSFKFQSFTRSSDGAFVICFVCVVCVVARGFGAIISMVAVCQGGRNLRSQKVLLKGVGVWVMMGH